MLDGIASSEGLEMQRSVVYRMYRGWYRVIPFIALPVFIAAGVVAAVDVGWAGLGFDLVWFLGIALVFWLNLYMTVFELRLEEGQFKWRAALRSGAVPLNEVRSVRNVFPSWPWPIVRFEIADRLSVFILGKRSLRAFVDRIAAECPDFRIDARSYATWRHELWVI